MPLVHDGEGACSRAANSEPEARGCLLCGFLLAGRHAGIVAQQVGVHGWNAHKDSDGVLLPLCPQK